VAFHVQKLLYYQRVIEPTVDSIAVIIDA